MEEKPKKIGGYLKKAHLPFEEMEVGDSFFCDFIAYSTIISKIIKRKKDFSGENYETRRENKGTRVWRTK